MFWRAARGRVGPNSRAGLHMAIFLLNPYGLYACILIPKWLASSPEMFGLASCLPVVGPLPRQGRMCQSALDFQSVYLAENVARRLQSIIWPSTPHFWHSLRWLASSPKSASSWSAIFQSVLVFVLLMPNKSKIIDFYKKI